MEQKKQVIFIIYVVLFFLLGLTLIGLGTNEQIGKKILGAYFIVGVLISFIFRTPIFGRFVASKPENGLDAKDMLANLFALVIGGYLLLA